MFQSMLLCTEVLGNKVAVSIDSVQGQIYSRTIFLFFIFFKSSPHPEAVLYAVGENAFAELGALRPHGNIGASNTLQRRFNPSTVALPLQCVYYTPLTPSYWIDDC